MKQELLISVHIPKTAGTTFGRILQNKYSGTFLFVYVAPWDAERYCIGRNDEELAQSLNNPEKKSLSLQDVIATITKEGITCIHGHFRAAVFLHEDIPNREKKFITWVREPHARAYSEYLHLKRDGRISLETPKQQVMQFLTDFGQRMYEMLGSDLSLYAFIGRTEYFDEDIRRFGIQDSYVFLNKTERSSHEPEIVNAIRVRMGLDILLYQAVCGTIESSTFAQQNYALRQYRSYVESSKFWKMRAFYLRVRWAFLNPLKFCRKYIWRRIPIWSQIRWTIANPQKCIKKYFFRNRWQFELRMSQQQKRNHLEKDFWKICEQLMPFLQRTFPAIDRKSKYKTVLVETRILPHTEFVIKNTVQKLGNGWGHMVFCSNENENQIRYICEQISPDIEIIILKDIVKTRNDYNNLLLSRKFWDQIDCEKVLVYQTDTILLKSFDQAFLEYDYIGGLWGSEHVKLIEDVYGIPDIVLGNGGLSLRNVQFIKDSLKKGNYKKFKPLHWNRAVDFGLRHIPEDLFFSICAYQQQVAIPSPRVAEEFSSEFMLNQTSFGLHQPWKFFATAFEMEKFIKRSFFQKQKKRILFINHQESLTGAPLLLKQIIKTELEKGEYDCWVLSLLKLDDPWSLQQRWLLEQIPGVTVEEKVAYLAEILNPDLVYGNTILSLDVARHFECAKVISIHEHRALYPYVLSGALDHLKSFDRVIVACKDSQKILARSGVYADAIPYYLDYRHLLSLAHEPVVSDSEYFLSIGTADFRKGFYRFCELARSLPDKKFIWVGALHSLHLLGDGRVRVDGINAQLPEYEYGDTIEEVSRSFFVPKNVELKGLLNPHETQALLRTCSALLMVSSDDPFPLVVIEAKLFNRNVVTLKESGDSYKLCDAQDLILDNYDQGRIRDYLNKCESRPYEIKKGLVNILNNNFSINRKIYTSLLKQKIKVFTAIHSLSQPASFDLMEKTLRSLAAFPGYDAKILVDAVTPQIKAFEKYGEIIVVRSQVEEVVYQNFPGYKAVLGGYLRLEIPAICKSQGYEDRYVMYVDYDVLFLKDPANLIPKYHIEYVAMTSEFFKNKPEEYNSGVLWMNVKNFGKRQYELFDLIRRQGHTFFAHDQEAIRRVFKGQVDRLDPRMNWKPYWGSVSDVAILHFHWLKPAMDLSSDAVQGPLQKSFRPGDIDMSSCKKYITIWNKY